MFREIPGAYKIRQLSSLSDGGLGKLDGVHTLYMLAHWIVLLFTSACKHMTAFHSTHTCLCESYVVD